MQDSFARPHGKSPKGKFKTKVKIDNPGNRPTEYKLEVTGPQEEIEEMKKEIQ